MKDILKDKPCRWQDSRLDCWFDMPDSKLPCRGKDKCKFYEYNGSYIDQHKRNGG